MRDDDHGVAGRGPDVQDSAFATWILVSMILIFLVSLILICQIHLDTG